MARCAPASRPPSRPADGRARQVGVAPKTQACRLRHRLGPSEPFLVPSVRRDRERLRVATTDHLEIGHRVAHPDIREQPPVAVTGLPVHLEPDTLAADERHVEPGRRLAATLAADTAVRDLRRIDADVANTLDPAFDADIDGVAVVDVDHLRLEHRGGVRRDGRRCERDSDRQEHRRTRHGLHDGTITPG